MTAERWSGLLGIVTITGALGLLLLSVLTGSQLDLWGSFLILVPMSVRVS